MTPSAVALIEMLREESQVHDDITTSDGSIIARQRAEARRDTLDSLIQRLPRILRDIEAEAVEEYRGIASWLEDGAGIGDAA